MAKRMNIRRIYGEVNTPRDIVLINQKIRGQIRRAKTKARITELVKRSAYLCTLTYSPGFRKHLAGKIRLARKIAKLEYTKTAKLANKKLGAKVYDEKWG